MKKQTHSENVSYSQPMKVIAIILVLCLLIFTLFVL